MLVSFQAPIVFGTAVALAVVASGVFFLSALLTGIWKYRCMVSSESGLAPHYVDVAHRASLMYSFAALLVAVFAGLSVWPAWLNIVATLGLLFFFGFAIQLYIKLGHANQTDNMFRDNDDPQKMAVLMNLLIAGELGGFIVLFTGAVAGIFVPGLLTS